MSEKPERAGDLPAAGGRVNLLADCANCFGLCCVALPFAASADFAIDKPAGQPCPNLQQDSRCGIHQSLRTKGFPGCTVYDCFGAGQQVAQMTYHGRDWRQAPATAHQMFDVFRVMRQLHELLWYLAEALTRRSAEALFGDLRRMFEAPTSSPGPRPRRSWSWTWPRIGTRSTSCCCGPANWSGPASGGRRTTGVPI